MTPSRPNRQQVAEMAHWKRRQFCDADEALSRICIILADSAGSQAGLIPHGARSAVEHATLRHGCKWAWWAMSPAMPLKMQTRKILPMADVVIIGISASFRPSNRVRNLSEVGP